MSGRWADLLRTQMKEFQSPYSIPDYSAKYVQILHYSHFVVYYKYMEKVDRRTFLRRGLVTALALGALPSVLACGPEGQQPQEFANPDQLSPEQTKLLKDRTWQSLTEVLNGDLFSEDSLTINQINLTKGNNPKIAKEDINILGTLRGYSRQLGVEFRVTYAKDVTYSQEPLKLDVGGNTLTVGEELGKGLKLDYFIGENAGDVLRHHYYADVVRNPESMKKRFENMQAELKRILIIPDHTPFIPEQDFNGLVTFVNHRIGYGLYMESEKKGIDGKGVTINLTEGLLTNNLAWTNVARRYHNYVRSDQISFKEILRVALDNLEGKPHSALLRSFRHVDKDNAHAAEYITKLGEQYLPNQPQVSGR